MFVVAALEQDWFCLNFEERLIRLYAMMTPMIKISMMIAADVPPITGNVGILLLSVFFRD